MAISTLIFGTVVIYMCVAEELATENTYRHPACSKRNDYYQIENSCDSYIECRDYKAQEMLCPDGLHFNPEAAWPSYPCGYPMDVPCRGRTVLQPAISNSECPHLYGFYASSATSPSNCGQYRMCVDGRAIEMICPAGLAFNVDTGRCDWPDTVPSCNSEAFLGFKCPQSEKILNYRNGADCYSFFSCEDGRARLLSCDEGRAFDASAGRCVPADRVHCESYITPRTDA